MNMGEALSKRLIEIIFPIIEVGNESIREKKAFIMQRGFVSALHTWWTRHPLAASRAIAYATMIPAPRSEEELKREKRFVAELARWESSFNPEILERAREKILLANGGERVKVLVLFADGGSIPLECLRLGCEVHALDRNPVAVLILRAMLEYPQRYSRPAARIDGKGRAPKLLEDIRRWGEWVLREVEREIGGFYCPDPDGSIPIAYIWVRTIPCRNPSCGIEIPLMKHYWLVKKTGKKIALKPYIVGKKVEFRIIGQGISILTDFVALEGTVRGEKARCPACGSIIDSEEVKKFFKDGKAGQRLIAVMLNDNRYRLANENDLKCFEKASEYLERKRSEFIDKWGFDPIPEDRLPPHINIIRTTLYGLNTWSDLFNPRQKLALVTFIEKVRHAYMRMLEEGYDREYAKAVVTYLALGIDRLADRNSTLSIPINTSERSVGTTFARNALLMALDYIEINPITHPMGWRAILENIISVVRLLSHLQDPVASVARFSTTLSHYPDDYFDIIFIDSSYYDHVSHLYLSDFFYVWLRASIGDLSEDLSDLFLTPLIPKPRELATHMPGGSKRKARQYLKEDLRRILREAYRVLKPGGVILVAYTYKTTLDWRTLINNLIEAGFTITAQWPIRIRRRARSGAKESSIYLVARKIQKKKIGWYGEVEEEIKKKLRERLGILQNEGIPEADSLVAVMGSALEVISSYEKVRKPEGGRDIDIKELLDHTRSIVTDHVIGYSICEKMSEEPSLSRQDRSLTRFYILWRWAYGEQATTLDNARKLALVAGIDDLAKWLRKGFIRKEKELIKVPGPQDKRLEETAMYSYLLIGALHYAILLWRRGMNEDLKKLLGTLHRGQGFMNLFYTVAQAISDMLPPESGEKKLLDGFLSSKERLLKELGYY
ncbi:MAG: DNA methylase [Desulfurococcaceae archaeon]|nr:MAG: DNA methylase [Desulfurococcaceae archaeon]